MKGRLFFVGGTAIAVAVLACNALNGVGDLSVCEGADCVVRTLPDRAEPDDASDTVVDGGSDAPVVSCSGDGKSCKGSTSSKCVNGVVVDTLCSESCVDGECVPFPSCRNDAGLGCGAGGGAGSCCETIAVPGGTFNRQNDPQTPATVSAFKLDKYEVTIARFRAFVEAGEGTQAKPPADGAGAHPKIAGSGWNPAWNGVTANLLPVSRAALEATLSGGTWTATPGAGTSELRAITSVRWFIAFAFCAWDGGRLPTNAELNFAEAGGEEQRVYPWTGNTADTTFAAWDCSVDPPSRTCTTVTTCTGGTSAGMSPCNSTTCVAGGGTCTSSQSCSGCATAATEVAVVGRYPKGVGRWGHFDLSGNASEWVLDESGAKANNILLPMPCMDCARLVPANPAKNANNDDVSMIYRGGSWNVFSIANIRSTQADTDLYNQTSTARGIRCARD